MIFDTTKNTQFVNYRKTHDNIIVNIDNNCYYIIMIWLYVGTFNKHHTRVNTETD